MVLSTQLYEKGNLICLRKRGWRIFINHVCFVWTSYFGHVYMCGYWGSHPMFLDIVFWDMYILRDRGHWGFFQLYIFFGTCPTLLVITCGWNHRVHWVPSIRQSWKCQMVLEIFAPAKPRLKTSSRAGQYLSIGDTVIWIQWGYIGTFRRFVRGQSGWTTGSYLTLHWRAHFQISHCCQFTMLQIKDGGANAHVI